MQIMIRELPQVFFHRLCEWAFALMLFGWGVVLLRSERTFDGPAFAAFRVWIDEDTAGWLCLAGGFLRLLVLIVNGAWRPAYHLRAWMALSSMMLWVAIVVGFAFYGVGVWAAVYPVIAVFEAANVIRASRDAATADKLAHAGKPSSRTGAGNINGAISPT